MHEDTFEVGLNKFEFLHVPKVALSIILHNKLDRRVFSTDIHHCINLPRFVRLAAWTIDVVIAVSRATINERSHAN